MKRFDVSRWIPLGIDKVHVKKLFFIGLIFAILFSFLWFIAFFQQLSSLYEYDYKTASYILIEGRMMKPFSELLGTNLHGFPTLCVIFLLHIPYNYVYHRQGSKSIYLMRRLPNAFELHRRCIILPLCEALIALLAGVVILIAYYLLYINLTPQQCLYANQWFIP